jgi:selenocysteine lyase/cysteine desulfurase
LAVLHEANRRRAAALLGPGEFGELLAPARREAARLVGASPGEIALVPNTNVGINIAASIARQRRQAGDARRSIVLSAGEFPANVYPWLALEQDGFRVRMIAADELGRPREDALLEAAAAPDTAVLALSAVQFATGWRAPLEQFGALCEQHDVLFAVDAIQAAGVLPLDVRSARIDVLSSGAQKWLCSPFGTGFTFVRAELCRRYHPELYDDARRFEVGTLPFPEFSAMAATLGLINELGVETIWQHVQGLLEPVLEWVAARDDVTVASATDQPHRSAILCLRTADTPATFERLAAGGVACVLREGSVRLAPHFYNSPAELAHVLELLEQSA